MKIQLTEFNSTAIVTTELKVNALNLVLHYSLADTGTPEKTTIWPTFARIERKDGLWKSTCFELFIGAPGDETYTEINLSPCGGWNSYQFTGYRQGMKINQDVTLLDMDSNQPGVLRATLQLTTLPASLLVGPAAIVQHDNGDLDYFATAHGSTPDFHNRQYYLPVPRSDLEKTP